MCEERKAKGYVHTHGQLSYHSRLLIFLSQWWWWWWWWRCELGSLESGTALKQGLLSSPLLLELLLNTFRSSNRPIYKKCLLHKHTPTYLQIEKLYKFNQIYIIFNYFCPDFFFVEVTVNKICQSHKKSIHTVSDDSGKRSDKYHSCDSISVLLLYTLYFYHIRTLLCILRLIFEDFFRNWSV